MVVLKSLPIKIKLAINFDDLNADKSSREKIL